MWRGRPNMAPAVFHFGPFELIASRFELRRDGAVVKLERIPMDLLIVLAEHNGDVVSRPEIVDRLWGKDVFVDTEHGINTAVRKIRAALGEDAEHPTFVHTVPGKGYRLTLDRIDCPAEDPRAEAGAVRASLPAEAPVIPAAPASRRWPLAATAVA